MNAIIGRVSLRVVITTVFAALLAVMAGMTWFLTFRNGRASVGELAEQVSRLSMANIRTHLEQFFSTPPLLMEINTFAISAGFGPEAGKDLLARRFAAELDTFGSVVSVAFGDEQGDYIGMSRGIEGVPLELAVSDASTGRHLVGYVSDDQGRRFSAFDRSQGPFDARLRPWYSAAVAAGGPVWTPVYQWVSGDAGVDLVRAVRDPSGALRGVLDVSLTLSGIGKFLRGIQATPHSQSFIMERTGLLVAASAVETPYRSSGGALQRFSATDSADPTIRIGARAIRAALDSGETFDGERQFRLSVQGSSVFLRVARVGDARGMDWYFAEAIPEVDFAQHIYDDMRSTGIFVLLFLLASMLVALVVAQRIATPLKLLSSLARTMAAGNLKIPLQVRGTGEVVQLAQSFRWMAEELRRSFASLEESEARYRAFVSASEAGIFRLEARQPLPLSLPDDERVQWFYRHFFLAECNDPGGPDGRRGDRRRVGRRRT